MYCPNCGYFIDEFSKECEKCGYQVNGNENNNQSDVIDAEFTEETVKEESIYDKTDYNFDSNPNNENTTLSNGIKVLLVAITVLFGGIGPIVGLISGIVLMGKPYEDYRSFGKLLVILSIILFVISFLCCCLGGFVDIILALFTAY